MEANKASFKPNKGMKFYNAGDRISESITFSLLRTIAFWILQNIESAPEEKLRAAFEDCLVMRDFPNRKKAD